MNKLKVLLVAEATGGGVRRHIVDLLQGIDQTCFSMGLVYGTKRADSVFFDALPKLAETTRLYPVVSLQREISLGKDIKALLQIIKAIRDFRPDVVHCHSSKAGALGRVAAKLCGVQKIIYTPHAYSFQNPTLSAKKYSFYRRIEATLSRWATTVTCNVSQGERECALTAKLDAPQKFVVVHNGVKSTLPPGGLLRPRLHLPPEAKLVGCAARIDEQKDPMTFLAVAQRLHETPNLHFVWMGSGPLAQTLQAQRDALGLQQTLLLPGYFFNADLLVGELDVYLSTARYEGMPYAPLEALRAGVPVLATDVVGNNEIALPGRSGQLFAIQDSEAAARLLEQELSTPTVTAQSVRAVFEEYFTLDGMIKGITAIYQNGPAAERADG